MPVNTKAISSRPPREDRTDDPLFVQSVEKAFRVLTAFDATRPTMSLSQLAVASGLDKSTAQRFAHTLERLCYLSKDPRTKHYALTTRTLGPAYHYTQSNPLLRRALPYLIQLSSSTEEAVNLSVLEDAEIVFVARFVSRHTIAPNVTVGTHLPAYCTAPGIAMLSHMPTAVAQAILRSSKLRAYTPSTIWRMPDLMAKLRDAATRGYAVCSEAMRANDISIAAPVLDGKRTPIAAVNLAFSKLHHDVAAAEQRFASLVVATAEAISG